MANRSLSDIAREIIADYRSKGKPVHFSAVPYVDAMRSLDTMDDRFYEDDAETVVIYALSNLSTWRGETATRVKRELRVMLHEHNPRRHKMPK
jgi:hypothetical protein